MLGGAKVRDTHIESLGAGSPLAASFPLALEIVDGRRRRRRWSSSSRRLSSRLSSRVCGRRSSSSSWILRRRHDFLEGGRQVSKSKSLAGSQKRDIKVLFNGLRGHSWMVEATR